MSLDGFAYGLNVNFSQTSERSTLNWFISKNKAHEKLAKYFRELRQKPWKTARLSKTFIT